MTSLLDINIRPTVSASVVKMTFKELVTIFAKGPSTEILGGTSPVSNMKVYRSRPKSGNGRKAWDKFTEEFKGEPPLSVEYTPNYDCQYRGWICEWDVKDVALRQLHYSHGSQHTFYPSCEL